jgi:predicted TIM-barrel fold metal-dependent hydrolase
MGNLLLSDFKPESELVVKRTVMSGPKYPVIDFHTHIGLRKDGYSISSVMDDLKAEGVAAVVNLDGFWDDRLDLALEHAGEYQNKIAVFASVDVMRIDEPDFEKYVVDTIKKAHQKGAAGLKFFKDVSLKDKDSHGNYIRVDDKRLVPIWKTAADLKLPVLIHIADPTAFFKPIDGRNERYESLVERPEWSFYGHEFFTFDELMEMQVHLLEQNPDTTFVVAHCGSYAENLEYVSHQLDKYPNMYIDTAARIRELGRQPYTARDFILKYQDRIVFGTDMSPKYLPHPYYYRFLETWDEYFNYSSSEQGSQWKIYGIGLPDEVLKKVYYENACKLVPQLHIET